MPTRWRNGFPDCRRGAGFGSGIRSAAGSGCSSPRGIPELSSALFLIAAAGLPPHRTLWTRARRMPRQLAFRIARAMTPEGPARDRLRERYGSSDYRTAGAMRPVLVKAVNEDLSDVARRIRMPVVLVHGEGDTESPPEIASRLHALIPAGAASSAARFRPLDDHRRRPASGDPPSRRVAGEAGVNGILALLGFGVFALRRLLTYLHLFQQEEYDNRRFLAWLVTNRAWDQRLSLALLIVWLMQVLPPHQTVPNWVFGGLAGAVCVVVTVFERDPRKTAKKRLAMTARAKRIYAVALALLAIFAVAAALATGPLAQGISLRGIWLWIVPVQLVPLALVGANLLLAPVEAKTQQRYWREAQEVLRDIDPMVIAITGSYGKTSVKHILGHILETAAPTLITPGSVNTAMGIARVIRERLRPHHRYFVVEMGAYGPGSIRRLCALTPPKMGIVTAIGVAHYERFKSLETVAEAKFELAEAVAENAGTIVAAADVLGFAAPRRFIRSASGRTSDRGFRGWRRLHGHRDAPEY
jgi:hypothetical protein